eukprot:g1453.t1
MGWFTRKEKTKNRQRFPSPHTITRLSTFSGNSHSTTTSSLSYSTDRMRECSRAGNSSRENCCDKNSVDQSIKQGASWTRTSGTDSISSVLSVPDGSRSRALSDTLTLRYDQFLRCAENKNDRKSWFVQIDTSELHDNEENQNKNENQGSTLKSGETGDDYRDMRSTLSSESTSRLSMNSIRSSQSSRVSSSRASSLSERVLVMEGNLARAKVDQATLIFQRMELNRQLAEEKKKNEALSLLYQTCALELKSTKSEAIFWKREKHGIIEHMKTKDDQILRECQERHRKIGAAIVQIKSQEARRLNATVKAKTIRDFIRPRWKELTQTCLQLSLDYMTLEDLWNLSRVNHYWHDELYIDLRSDSWKQLVRSGLLCRISCSPFLRRQVWMTYFNKGRQTQVAQTQTSLSFNKDIANYKTLVAKGERQRAYERATREKQRRVIRRSLGLDSTTSETKGGETHQTSKETKTKDTTKKTIDRKTLKDDIEESPPQISSLDSPVKLSDSPVKLSEIESMGDVITEITQSHTRIYQKILASTEQQHSLDGKCEKVWDWTSDSDIIKNPWGKSKHSALEIIEADISRTGLKQCGEKENSLRRILSAYSISDPEIGYCQGMNFVTALLLETFNAEHDQQHLTQKEEASHENFPPLAEVRSFLALHSMLNTHKLNLRKLYGPNLKLTKTIFFQLERLVCLYLPKLHLALDRCQIDAPLFASGWCLTLFASLETLSFRLTQYVFDQCIIDGWVGFFRCVLGLLSLLEKRLLKTCAASNRYAKELTATKNLTTMLLDNDNLFSVDQHEESKSDNRKTFQHDKDNSFLQCLALFAEIKVIDPIDEEKQCKDNDYLLYQHQEDDGGDREEEQEEETSQKKNVVSTSAKKAKKVQDVRYMMPLKDKNNKSNLLHCSTAEFARRVALFGMIDRAKLTSIKREMMKTKNISKTKKQALSFHDMMSPSFPPYAHKWVQMITEYTSSEK